MKHSLIHLLVLFTLLIFADANENTFSLGKQYNYEFSNDVFINDFKGGKPIAYRVTGIVSVANILATNETKLLKFTLQKPQLNVRPHGSHSQTEFRFHKSPLDQFKNNDFYGIWTQGVISDVYVRDSEDVALVNLKKGIAGLFQYKTSENDFTEIDATGVCTVTYRAASPNSLRKIKRDCKATKETFNFERVEQPLLVAAQNHRSTEYYFLADGNLEKVKSRDYYHIALEANRNIGSSVDSFIVLQTDGNLDDVSVVKGKNPKEFLIALKNYKGESLESQPQVAVVAAKSNIKNVVKEKANDLDRKYLGTITGAKTFIEILSLARASTKNELVKILKAKIVLEHRAQILDILGAAQTTHSHAAVKEVLDLNGDKDTDNIERYLQALAIGTRPNSAIILDLLNIVDSKSINNKVKATLINTLGSMAYRFALLSAQNYSLEVVKKVQSYLNESLAICKDPECQEEYLRGLQNLQSPETIDLLFEYVEQEERSVSVAAIKALQKFPVTIWNGEQIKLFEDIFYQTKKRYDSSTRTLALDIVLDSKPNVDQIGKLILHLKSNDRAFEVKKYLWQKIQMLAEQNAELNKAIRKIISSDNTLNNYHIIGQKGLSTALSRQYSIQSPFNSSITSIQEIFGGVLKRGLVDMTIDTPNNKYSLFTLGLYSGGLSSFVSSSTEDSNESNDESANAGMEITVQGSHFRPLVFFNGQGELMGHVWSGTASDPTPAYTATTLLHDHQQSIQLHNGATISIDVSSALSIDLNGAVQLSLWNRNAQCQVKKNTGLVISGKILVNAGFVTLDSKFIVTREPKLNLNTDIDFSAENLLCMQLSQPDDVLIHDIEKNQIIPKIRHHVKTIGKYQYKTVGLTHFLNKKNNDMCNRILTV